MIFVFDTTVSGHHARGAALRAMQSYGAIYGKGEGLQGSAYAIPVVDDDLMPLPLAHIRASVLRLFSFAGQHPDLDFQIAPIGVSGGHFLPHQIAPLFADAPQNCDLPYAFIAANAGHDVSDPEMRRRRLLGDAFAMVDRMTADMTLGRLGVPERIEAYLLMMNVCYIVTRDIMGDQFILGWLDRARSEVEADLLAHDDSPGLPVPLLTSQDQGAT